MVMKRLLYALLLMAAFALPAKATDFIDMDICIGKQIVARSLCKPVEEVNYVTRLRDNIYLFSAFYAKKETHFFVGVYKNIIRIQGKEFKNITRTIPYNFEESAKCAVIEYSVPDCPTTERIVCCSEKTIEEKLDDKFWDKTIPELLEEDLEEAIRGDGEPTKDVLPEKGPTPDEAPQPDEDDQ